MMDSIAYMVLTIIVSIISITSLLISLRTRRSLLNIIRLLETYPRVFERLAKVVESKRKVRKRYIVIWVMSSGNITRKELDRTIRDTIRNIIGVKGLADTDYALINYDERSGLGIIRSNNKMYKIVIGLLGMVRTTNNERIFVIPISTHGTVKKAKEKIKSLSKY